MKIKTLILGLLCISGLASAQELKTFEIDNMSIEHPANWEIDTSGMMRSKFIIKAPKENDQDQFQENVNLIIQDLAKTGMNMNLEEFHQLSKSQYEQAKGKLEIVDEGEGKAGDHAYKSLQLKTLEGQVKLSILQRYFMIDGKAYVLTFTAETNNIEDYRELSKKILTSFKIQ